MNDLVVVQKIAGWEKLKALVLLAFYLKESLGTSIEVFTRFTQALSSNLKEAQLTRPRYVWLQSRPARSREPIEVRIPLMIGI